MAVKDGVFALTKTMRIGSFAIAAIGMTAAIFDGPDEIGNFLVIVLALTGVVVLAHVTAWILESFVK